MIEQRHDDQAEENLLGCILAGADPTDLPLTPGMFYQPRNEAIFRACLTVADTGKRCDPQTVAFAMGDNVHKLQGGPVFLVNLAEHAIPHNAFAFANKIVEWANRRQLIEVADRIKSQADRNPEELREDARGWLDVPSVTDVDAIPLAAILPDFIAQVEAGNPPGLSVPWPEIDRHLQGLHPGRLYTVGARPGAGKSTMLTNVASWFASHHQQGVYFATLEMPAKELTTRVVSANARINTSRLSTATMEDADWNRLNQSYNKLAGMKLHIADNSQQTLRSIRAGARSMARKTGLGLVVVDYLQLLEPPDRRITRQQQIGELTRGLKRLAKELEVPVITASQLRRPQEGRNTRPTLADLRESGDIEADSDAVILLWAPDEELPWEIEAVIAKNRAGSRGNVDLMFDMTRATIETPQVKLGLA